MSISQGIVEISDTGAVSGEGAALHVYEAIIAVEPPLNDPETPSSEWIANGGNANTWRSMVQTNNLRTLKSYARQANAISTLVSYLVSNAEVKTTISPLTSIQRLPAILSAGQPTAGPLTDIFLEGRLA